MRLLVKMWIHLQRQRQAQVHGAAAELPLAQRGSGHGAGAGSGDGSLAAIYIASDNPDEAARLQAVAEEEGLCGPTGPPVARNLKFVQVLDKPTQHVDLAEWETPEQAAANFVRTLAEAFLLTVCDGMVAGMSGFARLGIAWGDMPDGTSEVPLVVVLYRKYHTKARTPQDVRRKGEVTLWTASQRIHDIGDVVMPEPEPEEEEASDAMSGSGASEVDADSGSGDGSPSR